MSGADAGRGLDLDHFRDKLLESTAVGLAILEPDTLRVVYHNPRLAAWFSALEDGVSTLPELLPELDPATLRKRLEKRGRYGAEAEVSAGRRSVSLSWQISPADGPHADFLVFEAHNVSKLKELEYMIESYSTMVEKQNRNLQKEKERAERLLLNIMPKKVYEEIKAFGVTTPQRFESASVVMLDFVDFTEMTVSHDPSALIAELNDIFTSFDKIAEQFGCERIKTIGDAYMAVCGVPEPASDHGQTIAKVALLFVRYIERRNASHSQQWRCRVGIATGPVIGSIVGVQKYVYDIFGPAVNLAARMEELADPMEIALAGDTWRLIQDDFRFEDRGEVEVKGFGTQRVYRLLGEHTRLPSVGGPRFDFTG